MTKVTYTTKNGRFIIVKIEGHAGYAQKGSDIVCAGISSIVEGSFTFFKLNYFEKLIIERDKVSTIFSILDYNDKLLQACLKMFIHQLENVSHFYPNYVTVLSE